MLGRNAVASTTSIEAIKYNGQIDIVWLLTKMHTPIEHMLNKISGIFVIIVSAVNETTHLVFVRFQKMCVVVTVAVNATHSVSPSDLFA